MEAQTADLWVLKAKGKGKWRLTVEQVWVFCVGG